MRRDRESVKGHRPRTKPGLRNTTKAVNASERKPKKERGRNGSHSSKQKKKNLKENNVATGYGNRCNKEVAKESGSS